MAKIVDPYIQFYNSNNHVFVDEMCKYFHGQTATFWPQSLPGHIHWWAARKGTSDPGRYGLNFQQFSDACRPYGKNWRIVPAYASDHVSPLDAYSLKYFHPYSYDFHVLPIVLVAKDFSYANDEVKTACDNFLHNVNAVSDWYATQLGKGFCILRPMAIPSQKTVNEWKAIYDAQADRYDLWKVCYDWLRVYFDQRINNNIIYLITQYNGNTPNWDYDAAGGGNVSVVSSFACNWRYAPGTPSPMDETVMYAIAHELGHCFGLGHTEKNLAVNEDWGKSVMMWGKPNDAILVEYEKQRLRTNPFFSWT